MNTHIINQEILLMATTTFSQKQLCKKDTMNDDLSTYEQLEEACWNGLLDELLPGILKKSISGKKLSLWQIRRCEFSLQIELSDSLPLITDNEFSIDPYLFIDILCTN